MKLPSRTLFLAIIAALALSSCAEPVRVVVQEPQPPAVTTPQNAVKLFEWAMNNRGTAELEELFTEDFAFVTAGADSAGNPTRVTYDREWLLAKLRCMFKGGLESPPAQRIMLNFDKNLIPRPDDRDGYRDADSLFKSIRTSLDCAVEIGDGSTFEVTGYALFYVVRGDAAAIPPELMARGVLNDKRRWWISRWEDETVAYGKPQGATDPTRAITLGAILRLFNCPP